LLTIVVTFQLHHCGCMINKCYVMLCYVIDYSRNSNRHSSFHTGMKQQATTFFWVNYSAFQGENVVNSNTSGKLSQAMTQMW